MGVNLESYLESIAGNEGRWRESVDIRVALDRYPELAGLQWGSEVVLASKEFNDFVTDVRFERLPDGRHVAMPYLEDMAVKLYSDPVAYFVATDNPNGFGLVSYLDWDEQLVNNRIPRAVIRKIGDFLDKRKPANYW